MLMEKIRQPRGAGKGALFLLNAFTLSFFILLSAVPAHAANMLTNPGYETGDITGWTGYAEDVHAATDTIVHTGSWAGMLEDSAGTFCYAYQVCPATPTLLYNFSGWVYLSSGTNAQIRVD